MKLRLRLTESKETLKIEAPNSCTLAQLKHILSESLPNSPPSASIRLSLNRKDELQSNGADSLQSLGIAAGDLIFFSLEQPTPGMSSNSQTTVPPPTDSSPKSDCKNSECSTSVGTQSTAPEAHNDGSMILVSQKGKTLDNGSQLEETVNDMEIDDVDIENSSNADELLAEIADKSFSVPGFLRKVFMEELGGDSGCDHKLIVIAVHAVMLESGFVGFDKNANVVINGFQFRNEWPSSLFRVSLFYTLPESLSGAHGDTNKHIVLKFQSLGKYINVYGTLENGSGKRGTYRVQLNEDQSVPFLHVVWANCGVKENITGKDGVFSGLSPEKEVFNFWRTVKDSLALPLLIDLCEETGLGLPPCFMQLPTDLKLKILESLSGIEIAKVSCVCSELQYLGSSDDLWKLKFVEEFGNERKEAEGSWKKSFESRFRAAHYWPAPYWPEPRRRRYPNPFMVQRGPRIIGGDYDVGPAFGDDLQNRLHGSVNRRKFSPYCFLGLPGERFI